MTPMRALSNISRPKKPGLFSIEQMTVVTTDQKVELWKPVGDFTNMHRDYARGAWDMLAATKSGNGYKMRLTFRGYQIKLIEPA